MLLQSGNQVDVLVGGLQDLLGREKLVDLTLAAGGRSIRAHRVVLAAASRYLEDLLGNYTEQMPVVFFKDVSFAEIESLVQYIYTGEVEVPGSSLQSFLSLADSLGVTGFSQNSEKTPSKRKLEWGCPPATIENLAATVFQPASSGKSMAEESRVEKKAEPLLSEPCTPSKSRSEPASLFETVLQGSTSKKRKLQTQSLTDELENLDPSLFNLQNLSYETRQEFSRSSFRKPCSSSRGSPLLPCTPGRGSPFFPHSPYTNRVQRTDSNATVRIKPSPLKDKSNHAPSSSCPVPPSPNNSSTSAQTTNNPSNFSFDSHFLDPDELAAKGATLLHHLAVWMIQQRKDSQQQLYQGSQKYVGDDLPSPNLEDEIRKSAAPAATRQQSAPSSSLPARKVDRRSLLSGSEGDRPDSGFDSKDDQEEDGLKENDGSEGSPEIGEISRQAMARQPIKKKRVFHHNMV